MGNEKDFTKSNYPDANVEACKSVLIELINLLGEFKDSIVLVGGWVPALMYPDAKPEHIRSLDIDLAFDHRTIDDETYTSLENVLLENNYFPEPGKTYSYYKDISTAEGKQINVKIDILSGVYGGRGKGRRHQIIQNVKARKLQGADLAFENFEIIKLEGVHPTGERDSARLKIAGVIPFLIMKGLVLRDRNKTKDVYDIWFCLKNHPEGLDDLIEKFKPYIDVKIVKESLLMISDKFESIEHIGPFSVANFLELSDAERIDEIKLDAFMRVDYLLKGLGVREG